MFSKISGGAASGLPKVIGTPIQGAGIEPVPPPSPPLKLPPGTNIDGGPQTLTTTSPYFVATSFEPDAPVIVYSSEFVSPIEPNGKYTTAGSTLSLKYDSDILSAKLACNILTQNQSALSASIANKDILLNFMNVESALLDTLSSKINGMYTSLGAVEPFTDFLKSVGYNFASSFTPTKTWQQTLIELRKMFSSNSNVFVNKSYSRSYYVANDLDQKLLSDTKIFYQTVSSLHVWFNPNISVTDPIPTYSAIVDFKDILDNILSFATTMGEVYQGMLAPRMNAEVSFPAPFTDTVTTNYVAFLSNCILKEMMYSKALSTTFLDENFANDIGYNTNFNTNNFSIWNYIIGSPNTEKSHISMAGNVAGNGRSLLSYSAKKISEGEASYDLLPLEKSHYRFEPSKPGSVYYADESLKIGTNDSFDINRIDTLMKEAGYVHTAAEKLETILGQNSDSEEGKLFVKYNIENILSQLTPLTDFYRTYLGSPDKSSLEDKFTGDQQGIRLHSLIFKTAVDPHENYSKISKILLGYLFIHVLRSIKFKDKIPIYIASSMLQKIDNINVDELSNPIFMGYSSAQIDLTTKTLTDLSETIVATMNSGLFKIVKGIMSKFIDETSAATIYDGDFTRFSRFPKLGFIFSYFVLVLKIIAALTPQEAMGFYYQTIGSINISYLAVRDVSVENMYDKGEVLLDADNVAFTDYQISSNNIVNIDKQIVQDEFDFTNVIVGHFKSYANNLKNSANDFKNFLLGDFQNYLNSIKGVYSQDLSLKQDTKNQLLDSSLSTGQITMTNYLFSEMRDRIENEKMMKSNLKSLPAFKDFPEGFENFMDIQGFDLVSYQTLVPYFVSSQFSGVKSVNKRIFGVGIPPLLLKDLKKKNSLFAINVYKNDILRPNVVFKPITYYFDSDRFPTRSLNNWDFEAFFNDTFDLFSVPTKVKKQTATNSFTVHRNYQEAINDADNSFNALPAADKTSISLQVYSNHVISFLIDEYMRWFTDCRFDEASYFNYGGVDKDSPKDQQEKAMGNYFGIGNNTPNPNVTLEYIDPVSGTKFTIPTVKPPSVMATSQKQYVIPINDTLRSFFKSETFLMNPEVIKRRLIYPKKFDRVYNLLVDPDDFFIDQLNTSNATINNLASQGIVISEGAEYKYRDTTQDDTTFCEYFFAVKSYLFDEKSDS